MQSRQVVQHIGEQLALMLPCHVQAPQRVLQRFVAHRHLACERLLVQVHQGTAQLEILREVICPVHAQHRLALHVEHRVALHRYVHRRARIQDALVDDSHRTHGVVHRVVAVLRERHATGRHLHRSARNVVGTQLDYIAARSRIFTREQELVLLGNLLRRGLGRVIQLLKHILVGHRIVADYLAQVRTEGLDHGEDDTSRVRLHRVSLHIVVESVRVGILLRIQAVQVHQLQQRLALQVTLRQVGQVRTRAVALILYVEAEILRGDAVGPQVVDVLHHQVPRRVGGRRAVRLQQLHIQRIVTLLLVGRELTHLVSLACIRILEGDGQHLVRLQGRLQRHITQRFVQRIFALAQQACVRHLLIVRATRQHVTQHGTHLVDVAYGVVVVCHLVIQAVRRVVRHALARGRPHRIADA